MEHDITNQDALECIEIGFPYEDSQQVAVAFADFAEQENISGGLREIIQNSIDNFNLAIAEYWCRHNIRIIETIVVEFQTETKEVDFQVFEDELSRFKDKIESLIATRTLTLEHSREPFNIFYNHFLPKVALIDGRLYARILFQLNHLKVQGKFNPDPTQDLPSKLEIETSIAAFMIIESRHLIESIRATKSIVLFLKLLIDSIEKCTDIKNWLKNPPTLQTVKELQISVFNVLNGLLLFVYQQID
ncbi:hypothetical protein JW766_00975 [Candidatus Dojkabacteria bacterium]|nr:hypothetical protein [Candidatus Dojkabacteria bacterium]